MVTFSPYSFKTLYSSFRHIFSNYALVSFNMIHRSYLGPSNFLCICKFSPPKRPKFSPVSVERSLQSFSRHLRCNSERFYKTKWFSWLVFLSKKHFRSFPILLIQSQYVLQWMMNSILFSKSCFGLNKRFALSQRDQMSTNQFIPL